MDLTQARELAATLMAQHRLTTWHLVFDNARTRAGSCRADRKEIALSRHLIGLYSPEQVTETVLHEIAHALVGPRHGHDRVWRAAAQRLGCSGKRCIPADAPQVDGAWTGTCPAGHRTTGHRRPIRVKSCPECSPRFTLTAVYTWTHLGNPAPMHPRYEAELARLRTAGTTPAPATPPVPLRIGDRVLLTGAGKYADLTGTIVKRGRSRYHVQTTAGLLSAAFTTVHPLPAEQPRA